MPDIDKITAVIFDLGGVIIDLDQPATYSAFAQMSGKTIGEVREIAAGESFFHDYELGKLDDPTFRAHIREALNILNEDEEIDAAWNVMLRGIPSARMETLARLQGRFDLFVMSNTNDIHFRQIKRIARHAGGGKEFYDYFKEVYLSQEIEVCKPDLQAWQVILNDHQLDPGAALFIDDKLENVQAAASLGIQTFHNIQPDDWMAMF